MSDALPLPPRPDLEQYKKLAKEFQRACKSGDAGAVRRWILEWTGKVARLEYPEITPELRQGIRQVAARMEQGWTQLQKTNEGAARGTLTGAQFFIARCHGFPSWPKFARHLEALAVGHSQVSQFEAAVDAIVTGNLEKLKRLLTGNPKLVRERSLREHRSTLLHYVSANGVEDFRQKTPKNIVEITRLLLESGADVNAESEAYGGRSTTLGLAATSCHPDDAGVQIPLMETLIEHGAIIDGPDSGSAIIGCLRNGRMGAAEFFANRGARMTLEGAAGLGRLDAVESFFDQSGNRLPSVTQEQMMDAFSIACWFGRVSVADYLLQRGVPVEAQLSKGGETGLHAASMGAFTDLVKLLLARGAPVSAKDANYSGTPLDWALYGWNQSGSKPGSSNYYPTVAALARAGAVLDPRHWHDPESGQGMLDKLRSDPRMQAALGGQAPGSGSV